MLDFNVKTIIVAAMAGSSGGLGTGLGVFAGIASPASIWPVAMTCAVLGALAYMMSQGIAQLVDNRTRTLRDRVERLQRDMGDVHGLVRLLPYTHDLPLPIGGGWALTGDSAAILVREALLRRPKTVLELGSGVSTLLLGQVLRNRGDGHVVSIDHDTTWAERTRRSVEFLGLRDYVTVVDAPLKRVEIAGQAFEWYDIPRERLDRLGPVDMLLVDGPPQARDQPNTARYPALPMLSERLSSDALIFVDDANRPTESAMVRRWQAENPGWFAEHFNTVDGVCMLSRR